MIEVDENNNNSLNADLNTNFNLALQMSEKNLEHDEIMEFLTCDNIALKQIAALAIDELKSRADALKLLQNLVGQDGKIREVIALKVNILVKSYPELFLDEKIYNTLLEAIIDVNANVCREIIESVVFLKTISPEFNKYFCPKLVDKINLTFKEIEKFNFRTKKFVTSKKMFNLYWCLEALGEFTDCIDFSTLKPILLKTGTMKDYTIREKTAKILAMNSFDDIDLNNLAKALKQDENYYVRRF